MVWASFKIVSKVLKLSTKDHLHIAATAITTHLISCVTSLYYALASIIFKWLTLNKLITRRQIFVLISKQGTLNWLSWKVYVYLFLLIHKIVKKMWVCYSWPTWFLCIYFFYSNQLHFFQGHWRHIISTCTCCNVVWLVWNSG